MHDQPHQISLLFSSLVDSFLSPCPQISNYQSYILRLYQNHPKMVHPDYPQTKLLILKELLESQNNGTNLIKFETLVQKLFQRDSVIGGKFGFDRCEKETAKR